MTKTERKWTIGNIVYVANALVLVFAGLLAGVNAASAQDRPALETATVQKQAAPHSLNSDVDCDPFQKEHRTGAAKLEDQMRVLGLIIAERQGNK